MTLNPWPQSLQKFGRKKCRTYFLTHDRDPRTACDIYLTTKTSIILLLQSEAWMRNEVWLISSWMLFPTQVRKSIPTLFAALQRVVALKKELVVPPKERGNVLQRRPQQFHILITWFLLDDMMNLNQWLSMLLMLSNISQTCCSSSQTSHKLWSGNNLLRLYIHSGLYRKYPLKKTATHVLQAHACIFCAHFDDHVAGTQWAVACLAPIKEVHTSTENINLAKVLDHVVRVSSACTYIGGCLWFNLLEDSFYMFARHTSHNVHVLVMPHSRHHEQKELFRPCRTCNKTGAWNEEVNLVWAGAGEGIGVGVAVSVDAHHLGFIKPAPTCTCSIN